MVGVVIEVAAAGADKPEHAGVAGKGRTLPPIASSACSVMPILNLAVPRRVIGVLFKIVRFLCRSIFY